MTGSDDDMGDEGADTATREAWTSRRVPSALGAVSDAVLDALGGVIALAASEARRGAETRLTTALEELDAERLEAEEYRLQTEEMARERAFLETEIGSEMASIEDSIKRIRSALVKAALTPDSDATETTAPQTTAAPRETRGESRSDIGATKPVKTDADALPANVGPVGPAPRLEDTPETAKPLERTRRTGRASKEEPGIDAGTVPPDVDAGIEAIVRTGEFLDWSSAVVALLGEALAARAAKTSMATDDTSGSGWNLGTRPTTDARLDAPHAPLNGGSHPTEGPAGRSGIP